MGWRRLVAVAAAAAVVAASGGCGMPGHEETTQAVKDATSATDQEIAHACQLMEGTTPPPGLDEPGVRGRLLGIATAIAHHEPSKERSLAYCEAITQ